MTLSPLHETLFHVYESYVASTVNGSKVTGLQIDMGTLRPLKEYDGNPVAFVQEVVRLLQECPGVGNAVPQAMFAFLYRKLMGKAISAARIEAAIKDTSLKLEANGSFTHTDPDLSVKVDSPVVAAAMSDFDDIDTITQAGSRGDKGLHASIPKEGVTTFLDIFRVNCKPWQWHRELFHNALEAIIQALQEGRFNSGETPRIRIGPDLNYLHFRQKKGLPLVYRWSIEDNAIGMGPEDLYKHMGELFTSGGNKVNSATDNFGVGARGSTVHLSPNGIYFMAWQDGIGYMVRVGEINGGVGLQPVGTDDEGKTLYIRRTPPEYDIDPYTKERRTSGFKVVLMGDSCDCHTYVCLPGEAEQGMFPTPSGKFSGRQNHLAANGRYWRLPEGVDIRAWESPGIPQGEEADLPDPTHPEHGWGIPDPFKSGDGNYYRPIEGQYHYYTNNKYKDAEGSVSLSDGVVITWMTFTGERSEPKDGSPGILRAHSRHAYAHSPGALFVIYKDEIYLTFDKKVSHYIFRKFGITSTDARMRMVLAIEVPDDGNWVTTSTRSQLTKSGTGSLPLEDWGGEFFQKMPDDVRNLLKEVQTDLGDQESKNRLRDKLLKFARERNSWVDDPKKPKKPRGPRNTPTTSRWECNLCKRTFSAPIGQDPICGCGSTDCKKFSPQREAKQSFNIPEVEIVYNDDYKGLAYYVAGKVNTLYIEYNHPALVRARKWLSSKYGQATEQNLYRTILSTWGYALATKILLAQDYQKKGTPFYNPEKYRKMVSDEALEFAALDDDFFYAKASQTLAGNLGAGLSA